MKRFFVLAFLVSLLFAGLTACSSNVELSDLEAYWGMRSVMEEVEDYALHGEVFIERIDLGRPVIHRMQSGAVSVSRQEAQIVFMPTSEELAPFFQVPISVLDGYVYADLAERTQWYIDRALAASDPGYTPGSVKEFVDSDTLVRASLTSPLDAHLLFAAFFDLFSEETLEQYLRRTEDSFTITIEGIATQDYAQNAIYAIVFLGGAEFVNEFVDADATNRLDVARFLAQGLAQLDWEDAYLTVRFTEEQGRFSLQADIYIPAWLSAMKSLAITETSVPPVTRPDGTVTSLAEFVRHLEAAQEAIAENNFVANPPVSFDSPESAMIAFLEEVRDSAPQFQALEILGFIPPEALSELYLSEAMQTNLAHQAEREDADQLVSRIALFELDGHKHLMLADVIDHGGAWHIFQLGGNIAMLLYLPPAMGHIPPEFTEEFLEGIDLQTVMIPV